jgi:hypothetical protein
MEEFWVVWGGHHGNDHVGHHSAMMTMSMTYMPSAIIMVRIYRVVTIQVWSLVVICWLNECSEEYMCSEKFLAASSLVSHIGKEYPQRFRSSGMWFFVTLDD